MLGVVVQKTQWENQKCPALPITSSVPIHHWNQVSVPGCQFHPKMNWGKLIRIVCRDKYEFRSKQIQSFRPRKTSTYLYHHQFIIPRAFTLCYNQKKRKETKPDTWNPFFISTNRQNPTPKFAEQTVLPRTNSALRPAMSWRLSRTRSWRPRRQGNEHVMISPHLQCNLG